jgi:CRP/FNR family transcriptional regulator
MSGKQSIGCFECQARPASEWCALSNDELAQLDSAKVQRTIEAGNTLFHQGDECDGIYCLKFGLVGIRRLDSAGNSSLLRLCGPGETIGYRSFLLKTEHRSTAEIMMPSIVCFIHRQTVRALLEQNPNLGLRFLDHNVKDAAEFEERHFESITFTVKYRLLNLLMVLYERFGRLDENGEPMLELPLSRQDIAALLGASPETISRSITKVQEEGLVQFKGRRVSLQNIEELTRQLTAS